MVDFLTDLKFSRQSALGSDALNMLFHHMSACGLRYATLGDSEGMPYSLCECDIVLVAHPGDLPDACAVVAEIALATGLSLANYKTEGGLTQFALVRHGAGGELQLSKIGILSSAVVYGVEVLSADEMLKGRRQQNGVPVVADRVLLLVVLLSQFTAKRPAHLRFDPAFTVIAKTEAPALVNVLARLLPDTRAAELVASLAEGQYSGLLISRSRPRNLLSRTWFAQNGAAILGRLRVLGNQLRNRVPRNGLFLSISGPDGAGKTTVIDIVIDQLEAIYGEGSVNYAHFRPTVFPRLAEVANRAGAVEKVDVEYDRPHRAKPSGLTGSAARLCYYFLDYTVGYFTSVRPLLKRHNVMLFDRYYYDMIADSFRSRIALPMPILRLMGHLMPLPEYAFFIHVSSEEVYRRKQELAFERIAELNNRYSDLADRGWLIRIDNNGSAEKAASAIVDWIIADRHAQAVRMLQ